MCRGPLISARPFRKRRTLSWPALRYGLEWNKVAEFGHAIVGERIDITLDVALIEE